MTLQFELAFPCHKKFKSFKMLIIYNHEGLQGSIQYHFLLFYNFFPLKNSACFLHHMLLDHTDLWDIFIFSNKALKQVVFNIFYRNNYRKHAKILKGIVHPKMKILSSFTHPQVVPNLYECLCSAEHKGRYSEECGKQSSSGAPLTSFHSICFPTMEVNGATKQPGYKLSSKYLPLCSAEQRNSYRFGTTWGWVNDDRIFIFGWTIPLRSSFFSS